MKKNTVDKWRNFLKESILEEKLLAEGRLQDAKKKYPELAQLGLIDYLSGADPSNNNKYLQWSSKQLNRYTGDSDEMQDVARRITDAVMKFHKYSQRLKKKDINQYKDWTAIIDDTAELQSIMTSKEKRQKEKEKMAGESSVVYESDNYFVVRPDTEEASCYFGRNTKWCISATESQNYFEEYTGRGRVFYMVRSDKKEDRDTPYEKIALVYNQDGLEEAYDALDKNIYVQDLATIFDEEYDAIIEATNDFTDEHPPEDSRLEQWIDEVEEIKNRYNERMSYAIIWADVEDYGDGPIIDASAGIEFPIKLDKLEMDKFNDLDEKTLSLIAYGVMEEFEQYGWEWADMSDYIRPTLREKNTAGQMEDGAGIIILESPINTRAFAYDGVYDPDGFEDFCSEVESEIDDKYQDGIDTIFERILIREGIVGGGAFEKLYLAIQNEEFVSDLWTDMEAGGDEITAEMDVDDAYFIKGLLNLEVSKKYEFDIEDILKIVKTPSFKHHLTDAIKHMAGVKHGYPSTYLTIRNDRGENLPTGGGGLTGQYINYAISLDRNNVTNDDKDYDVEAFIQMIEKIDTSSKFKDAVEKAFINIVEREIKPPPSDYSAFRQQKMKFPTDGYAYNESLVRNWKKFLKG